MVFDLDKVTGFEVVKESSSSIKKQIAEYLDLKVEKPLLEEFLSPNSGYQVPPFFYNLTTIGPFQKGNTFGGSPQSGAPDKAISFKNYAWESVSAASKSLEVDRRAIRDKRNKGITTVKIF
uniref:Putative GIY YIG homing endonuclease n=1 Tax=Chloromonas perforata TaxID=51730 RepID=A0A0S2LNU6_9CHLO|nr:putative GIY YIG homing endonuclease [Chloromonas perforata]